MDLTISNKYSLSLVQDLEKAMVFGEDNVQATTKDGKPQYYAHILVAAPGEKPELIRAKTVVRDLKVGVLPKDAVISAIPWEQQSRAGIAYRLDIVQVTA